MHHIMKEILLAESRAIQAPKACTTFTILDRAVFTLFSPSTSLLLHSVRISNLTRRTEYQKRGIRRIFMDHRILFHLEGGLRCQNTRTKRVLGVFYGVSHIFRISVSRLRAFMNSTNSYKSLLSILLHRYSYNSQSPYLVNPSEREWRGWIGWFVR